MGGQRWKVATIRGIPLYVGSSWLIIAAIYVYGQYQALTLQAVPPSPATAILLAILTAVMFFGSVLLHEAAHAVMARSFNLPVLGITLVFWGGATETRANARGPLAEFLVAFVGPATTLAMAGVFWVAERFASGDLSDILRYLAFVSVIFAALNTLPGFPLDGGRMFLSLVWGLTHNRRTAMRAAGYVGIAIGVAILAAALWRFAAGDTFIGIFGGYIGYILLSAGRGMDQRIAFREQLAGGTAADVMRPPPQRVPADMPLTQALDTYLRAAPGQSFPVVDGERVIGTVSLASARRVGGRDPMRPVREGMSPLTQTPFVAPQEPLDDVLEWLGGREGLVLRDGALVGSIAPGDVEGWYRTRVDGRTRVDVGAIPPRPDL